MLTSSAVSDLSEIWSFIAQDNPVAADRWETKLFSVMDKLGKLPALGHTRHDLTDKPYKFFPVGNYLIIFDPAPKPVHILRILHAARDLKALLDE